MFALRAYLTDNTPVASERTWFANLPITIGRNPQNDFALQHPAISGFHARLEYHRGKLCISDLGSSNGVYLAPAAGGELTRIGANRATDLGPAGNRFFLSGSVWVQLEIVAGESSQSLVHERQSRPDAKAAEVAHGSGTAPPAPAQPQLERRSDVDRGRVETRPTFGQASAHLPRGQHAASTSPTDEERALQSQCFNVSLDYLALQGLRELTRSLLPGQRLETTGDVARLIAKLHAVVDVFCRSFVPLRQGFEQFVSSLDLEARRSRRMSPSAAMLEVAKSPEQVALALLDPRDASADAAGAAESLLNDLARHQIALLDGMMQGVRALLDELSPDQIDAALDERGSAELFGAKYRARWNEFRERHQKLCDQREAFAVIFGRDFADVYRRYWQRGQLKG